jgi:small subunit ribosomal protein S6
MRHYELTIVLRPDMSTQEADDVATEVAAKTKELGMTIVKQENWGLRKLAYLINKMSKGYYVFFGLETDANKLHELERTLRLNENVIRQMSVRVDAISSEPSAPIRQDEERSNAA